MDFSNQIELTTTCNRLTEVTTDYACPKSINWIYHKKNYP